MFGKVYDVIKNIVPWIAPAVVASIGIEHGYPWMVAVMIIPAVSAALSDADLRKYAGIGVRDDKDRN